METIMSTRRRSVLFACAALLAAGALIAPVQAREGFGGFFFPAPFFAPQPGGGPFYQPPWRERYYAPPRQRKAARPVHRTVAQTHKERKVALAVPARSSVRQVPEQRKLTQPPRELQTAVAVPDPPTRRKPTITCEKAQAIVADYGFKDIKSELCAGRILGFHATRDGKPFTIEIVAANGELAKVRRLR
jgi:hypothetical protein